MSPSLSPLILSFLLHSSHAFSPLFSLSFLFFSPFSICLLSSLSLLFSTVFFFFCFSPLSYFPSLPLSSLSTFSLTCPSSFFPVFLPPGACFLSSSPSLHLYRSHSISPPLLLFLLFPVLSILPFLPSSAYLLTYIFSSRVLLANLYFLLLYLLFSFLPYPPQPLVFSSLPFFPLLLFLSLFPLFLFPSFLLSLCLSSPPSLARFLLHFLSLSSSFFYFSFHLFCLRASFFCIPPFSLVFSLSLIDFSLFSSSSPCLLP